MLTAFLEKARNDPFFRKKAAYKASKVGWYLFRMFLIFGLSFVLLYPLIYMITMSVRPAAEAYDPAVIWIPKSLTMDNFKETFSLMKYPVAFKNSVLINVVSSLLQVVVCATTGYSFARFNFKGKKILFGLVIVTLLIPPQVIINPLAKTFSYFNFFGIGKILSLFGVKFPVINLLDTPVTFYLPAALGAGIKSGLFVFIFRQFFRGLPRELEDAAAIDGCGFVKTYIKIMIPNSLVVCLAATILSIVWYWNDYFYSSIFVPNFKTVSLALTSLGSTYMSEHGLIYVDPYKIITLMQAGALITILPILLMYIILQRYFVEGIASSGLVG